MRYRSTRDQVDQLHELHLARHAELGDLWAVHDVRHPRLAGALEGEARIRAVTRTPRHAGSRYPSGTPPPP